MRASLALLLASTAVAGCSIRDATFTGRDPTGDGGIDGPAAALVVSQPQLAADEGKPATFTVALAAPPDGELTVSIGAGVGILNVVPPSLTFTAADYAQPQTVTVSTGADSDYDVEVSKLSLSAPGLEGVSLPLLIREPEILEVTPLLGAICEGDTIGASVRLRGNPRGTVTVGAAPATTGTVAPDKLVFTEMNYATAQGIELASAELGVQYFNITAPALAPRQYKLTVRPFDAPACQAVLR